MTVTQSYRYGLGVVNDVGGSVEVMRCQGKENNDGYTSGDTGATVSVSQDAYPDSDTERDSLVVIGNESSCVLILAKYDLRVEASIPLYIRQYITDFQTKFPISVVSYEDRGKFMSDVKGLHVYALPYVFF